MKASARRASATSYTHAIQIRQHRLTADEPPDQGGDDQGPDPQELLAASLAACVAITLEMYARRKGWEIGDAEVEARYEQAERGSPTSFTVVLRLPATLDEEQRERLRAIAAKCPVHRTLAGEVDFEEIVEDLAAGQSTT